MLFGSIRTYLNKFGISPVDGAFDGTIFNVTPKEEYDYNFVLSTLSNPRIFEYAMKVSKGTKIPVVGYDDLLEYNVSYNEDYSKYINKLQIRDRIYNNSMLIIELKKLRNRLLPLLMNSQLKIEDI